MSLSEVKKKPGGCMLCWNSTGSARVIKLRVRLKIRRERIGRVRFNNRV